MSNNYIAVKCKKKDIFKSIPFNNRQIPENNGGRYQQIEAIA